MTRAPFREGHMPQRILTALKNFVYAGKRVVRGESFTVKGEDHARALIGVGRATPEVGMSIPPARPAVGRRAESSGPPRSPKPAPKPPKGAMTAQKPAPKPAPKPETLPAEPRPDRGQPGKPDIGRPGRPDIGQPGRPDIGQPGRPERGPRPEQPIVEPEPVPEVPPPQPTPLPSDEK